MQRRAFLISGNPHQSYKVSNKHDVYFLNYFLQSIYGGSWKKEEITCLINPTLKELLTVINNTNEDYRFIYFSGHGCIIDNNQFIHIEDRLLNTANLFNKAPLEFIIFDCCRHIRKRTDVIKKYKLYEKEEDYWPTRKKSSNISLSLKPERLIVYATKAGNSSYALQNSSYFIYALAKILSKIKKLGIKKKISIFTFLKLISLSFKKAKNIQELVYST